MLKDDDMLLNDDELCEDDYFFNDEEDIALDLLAIDGEISSDEAECDFDNTIREFNKFNCARPMQNRLFAPHSLSKK